MRFFFLLAVTALLCPSLLAQQNLRDSAERQVMLNDVLICSPDSGVSESFSFYRTGTLSGTEDILSRIEGVNLIKRGAFGMEPMLRTYSAGQINLTLNGMKIYGACTDKMDPPTTYVEPGNLQKVAVTQGASGSMMGSSVGGHIDLQLREAAFGHCSKPVVNIFGQYTSVNGGINSGAAVNLNAEKVALRINATFRNAHNYHAGGRREVLYSGYQKMNLFVNGVWKLPRHQKILVDYIMDDGKNIGYPSLTMDVSEAAMQLVALTYRKEWKHVRVESKMYYNTVVHLMDDTHRPETVIHMDMPGWSYTGGAYAQLFFHHGMQRLDIRADAHRSETRADMTMYPVNERPMYMQTLPGNLLSNVGASMQYQVRLGPRYTSGVNYRFDGYEQYVTDETGILQWQAFGFDVKNPQYNLLHNVSAFVSRQGKYGNTELSSAYGSRLPTSNERLGFYLYNRGDGYDYLGRYDLRPETSVQLELKQNILFRPFLFSLTVFHHIIQHYISGIVLDGYSPMTIGARGVKTYEQNRASVSGFESTLSAKITPAFTYQANGRYTYAALSDGVAMQQVPPFKLVQTVRYQYHSMQVQLEQIYSGAQRRINPDFEEQATRAWSIVAVRLAYSWIAGSSAIQANLAIDNLFDTYYREHLSWGGIPQPGRNVSVGVNYYLN